MIATALHRSGWSLFALAAAAVLAGCEDETTLGPTERPAIAAARGPDLGDCDEIAAPEGSKLVYHVYAEGVQIYQWNGTSWAFQGPSANLYADAGGKGLVGTHSAGPIWESNGGSLVAGRLKTPCPVGAEDIPWLLLDGIRSEGAGVFNGVTSIQRVNTVGGVAPGAPGTLNEVRNVPYAAEYYFYQSP